MQRMKTLKLIPQSWEPRSPVSSHSKPSPDHWAGRRSSDLSHSSSIIFSGMFKERAGKTTLDDSPMKEKQIKKLRDYFCNITQSPVQPVISGLFICFIGHKVNC